MQNRIETGYTNFQMDRAVKLDRVLRDITALECMREERGGNFVEELKDMNGRRYCVRINEQLLFTEKKVALSLFEDLRATGKTGLDTANDIVEERVVGKEYVERNYRR